MKKKIGVKIIENVYNKCFYRTFEVLSHIQHNDFYVILDRRVLDLSNLMRSIDEMPSNGKNQSALEQLNMFGGTDISDLFEKRTLNKLEMFDLKSHSEYGLSKDLFWWEDPAYVIGAITIQERHVCIRNKAKNNQCHLTVCEEDSIYEIQAKFFAAYPEKNSEHIIWRKTESTCCPSAHLSLDKTLTENGLVFDPDNEVTFLWMFHKAEFTCNNSCVMNFLGQL
ncbi:cytochrome b5 domain-containing protein 1 [Contarinia nasturtii]|uniref:cytochrome b5 domain-containing protein 1 n=1 Tax=Contarinia nasturtii TaxID=265458 RepID=UPI0012D40662|nr:cytochrome b5 domain-containing protein 1 [Contarinia nasturtii]